MGIFHVWKTPFLVVFSDFTCVFFVSEHLQEFDANYTMHGEVERIIEVR